MSIRARGGLRFRATYMPVPINWSWPFAMLVADAQGIAIRYPFHTFSIPLSRVTRLSIYDGWFSKGIKIEHSETTVPDFVVFWSFAALRLRAELLKLCETRLLPGLHGDTAAGSAGEGA